MSDLRSSSARTQEQNVWQPVLRDSLEAHNPSGIPRLRTGNIEGPYNVTGISETPSRKRLFICKPTTAAKEAPCAAEILSAVARRAFRRPVTANRHRSADGVSITTLARKAATSTPASAPAWREFWPVRHLSFVPKNDPATLPAGRAASHHRSRTGVAPFVLPVEQHSRR